MKNIFSITLISLLVMVLSVPAYGQNKPNGVTAPVQSGLTIDPTPGAYTPGHFINYLRSYDVQTWGLSESNIKLSTQSPSNVLLTTSYFDGLGRPLQTVSRKAAPGGLNDIVHTVFYDGFGRQSNGYLPYRSVGSSGAFRLNPFTEQDGFYDGHFGGNEDVYYSKTEFDNSPLNRVTKQMPAGNSWAGMNRGVSTEYRLNITADEVRIPVAGTSTVSLGGVYAEGELSLKVTSDENEQKMREFTDKLGRVILKQVQKGSTANPGHSDWQSTYYAYDDRNNLKYILPPRAVELYQGNGWSHTTAVDNFHFAFGYDGRNRMISKKAPGAGTINMVYDRQNRPILTQDANQAATNQWAFTKYDALNREVLTGFITDASSRSALQASADSWAGDMFVTRESLSSGNTLEGDVIVISYRDPSIVYYRTKSDGSIEFRPGFESTSGDAFETLTDLSSSYDYTSYEDYHDATFPLLKNYSGFEVNTVNYYDDYDFTSKSWSSDFNGFYNAGGSYHAVTPVQDGNIQGRVTGSKVRILGTNEFLTTAMFYDDRGRVIQTHTDNHRGGSEVVTTQYDFTGRVLHTYTKHENPKSSANNSTRVLKQFTYDHAGRVLTVKQKLNDTGSLVTLASHSYNNLDQLSSKTLGGSLETLDYKYNIRGWLQSINGDELDDPSENGSAMTNHYFAMELNFDFGFNNAQYNGNIAGMKWKTTSSNKIRAYGFDYDAANRLTAADFNEGNNWLNTENDFSSNYSYDVNGNILSLMRKGTIAGTIETIDNLTYDYGSGYNLAGTGNQLLKVKDTAGDLGQHDFVDGNSSGDDYDYDVNGNMKSDLNKGITNITYNNLDLPEAVSFGSNKTITYVYDAAGIKLQKIVYDNGSITTTDYIGDFIYENDVLQHFSHEEGRVRRKADGTLVNDYYVKDQWDNTRLTLTSDIDQVEYRATMEVGTNSSGEVVDQYEEGLFLMLSDIRDNSVPTANTSNVPGISDSYSARLNGTDVNRRVGPGKMLVVSAGDQLNISVDSYHAGSYSNSSQQGQSTMLTSIAGLFGGVNTGSTEQQAIYDLFDGVAATAYVGTQGTSSKPKAYLNVLVFDQDFKLISGKSIFKQTTQASGHLTLSHAVNMSEGGFVYVYLSNEDNVNFNVHFDNLNIVHTKGAVLQEDHYYPFGLSIDALSSRAPLSKPNTYNTFQGQERAEDFDLGWYQFRYRNYDPTIARFFNVDPLASDYVYNSPYAFAENKLGRGVELEGLELKPIPWVQMLSRRLNEKMDRAGLSEPEKRVAGKLTNLPKMRKIDRARTKDKAENFSKNSGLEGGFDGNRDALRHGLFSAMNTQLVGEKLTRELGVAHEEGHPNEPAGKEADLHNNEIGIAVGKENPDASPLELSLILLDKLQDGEMLTVVDGKVKKTELTDEKKAEIIKKLKKLDEYGMEPDAPKIKPLPKN